MPYVQDYDLILSLSQNLSAAKSLHQDCYQCNNKQDVYDTSGAIPNKTNRPGYNKYYGDDIKKITHDLIFLVNNLIYHKVTASCRSNLYTIPEIYCTIHVYRWVYLTDFHRISNKVFVVGER